MATLDSPTKSSTSAEVDPTNSALRVSIRPLDWAPANLSGKVLGHYRAYGTSSAAAFTAGVNLGVFRWTDPTNFCVIMRVYATVSVVTAVTAQRMDPLALVPARAYTAADGTNATALTISGQMQAARRTMGASLMTANMAVASAAGGCSGGTKSADSNAIGALALPGITGLGNSTGGDLYKWDQLGQYPWVLTQNEGLLLQWGATTLATGTIEVGFGVDWAEVAAF
jgi:hypothetical protein